MVKKGILLIIIIASLFIINPVKADFNDDYQGFLKTYDAYRISHTAYITTRNQFLQYGTLNSQTEALNASKTFLIDRDTVLLSYISLIRLKNTDATYAKLLDDEENFLKPHQEKIPVVATLDDVVRVSRDVEARHIPFQITTRRIVGTLIMNKVDTLRLRFTLLETSANKLIGILRSQGKDVSVQERWLLDAKNKELLIQQKLIDVQNKIFKLQAGNVEDLSQRYNEIQFTIYEANQCLKEGLSFMTELSEGIKYGNF